MFHQKTLLITGGTGSFGNAVLRRFLRTDIGQIRIFSRDEKKQDEMRHGSEAVGVRSNERMTEGRGLWAKGWGKRRTSNAEHSTTNIQRDDGGHTFKLKAEIQKVNIELQTQSWNYFSFAFSQFLLSPLCSLLFALCSSRWAGVDGVRSRRQVKPMRLPPQYAEFFKAEAAALRSQAEVYLFGSRRDNARKGGDVDILVLSNPKLNWEESARIRRRFWEQFGFQKLDLVCFSPEDRSAFKELVLLDAIRL